MVAETVALPNLRELFIPDKGFIICDTDLAQADARVVAWEANDDELKAIFHDPDADLHDENAKTIFGNLTERNRYMAKRGVHAANYGVTARTLAKSIGISVHEADRFLKRWFSAHPGIKKWHNSVAFSLQTSRGISNKFGNRRIYFDRIEGILPEALAWIPQSTVALIINRGLCNLDENLREVQLLLQVHDSLVFQVPEDKFEELKPQIKSNLEITVPYEDPLVIPVGMKASAESWGACKEVEW